jgi:hypothetical protein
VRRFLLAVFACLPLVTLAAVPAFTIVPTIVVYPPSVTGDSIDQEASSRIATVLATEIAKAGDVKVLTPKPGVERRNFLSDARSIGADYYVTGFVTPIGDNVSVIEQVVSVLSGTVVFSASAQITTYGELNDQADQLREGILERAGRGLAAFQAPPAPQTTPAPAAQPTNGAEANVSGLFGRRRHAAPTPAAAASSDPLPANAVVAILAVGGSADTDQRTAAAQAIAVAFDRDGRHAVVVSDSEPSNAVCAANKATSLVAGWLDTRSTAGANASASLRLVGYDCGGKVAFDRTFTEDGSGPAAAQLALNAASDAAVGAYVVNPGKP